jgi:hypothetical protein
MNECAAANYNPKQTYVREFIKIRKRSLEFNDIFNCLDGVSDSLPQIQRGVRGGTLLNFEHGRSW